MCVCVTNFGRCVNSSFGHSVNSRGHSVNSPDHCVNSPGDSVNNLSVGIFVFVMIVVLGMGFPSFRGGRGKMVKTPFAILSRRRRCRSCTIWDSVKSRVPSSQVLVLKSLCTFCR